MPHQDDDISLEVLNAKLTLLGDWHYLRKDPTVAGNFPHIPPPIADWDDVWMIRLDLPGARLSVLAGTGIPRKEAIERMVQKVKRFNENAEISRNDQKGG